MVGFKGCWLRDEAYLCKAALKDLSDTLSDGYEGMSAAATLGGRRTRNFKQGYEELLEVVPIESPHIMKVRCTPKPGSTDEFCPRLRR